MSQQASTMGLNWKTLKWVGFILTAMLPLLSTARAADRPYAFNVLNQRSVSLTAQYWNPILIYVSKKSGVPLELKLAKSVLETNARTEQGAYDFLFTNHFFTPDRTRLGFRVIARPAGRGIRSQIVVPHNSAIRNLADLNGKEVGFPSRDAFAGYWLPMDALLKANLKVKTVLTGNQEASFAQLEVGTVVAAAVNDTVLERYARREGLEYRLLWTSELYNDLCIMASPKVPKDKVAAVRDAFVGMINDPDGLKVLQAGAELLKIKDKLGFIASDDADYENYRAFYKHTSVKGSE